MSYQVIARRWRPQKFDEVVFQDHVLRTIRNSVTSGRISHAYIFTGPRGVGKTTVARILAKSLNCVHGPTAEPCGVCENCVEIKNGTSFDVYEIDGASNTSVDNIRDLREKVNFAPVKSKYKVYIIDEVHMLSTGAFNALLKTLEEPPAHVVFIFATTEIHKVPETILSRCQKYTFRKIPVDAVADHLGKILKSDKIDFDQAAIFPIARASGGSMRDAQSLLEQVISFSAGKITEESALESLGVVPFSSYCRVLASLASSDRESLIKEIDSISSSGANLVLYTAGFAEIIRSVRLLKNGVYIYNSSSFSKEEAGELKKLSSDFSDEELSAFFKIINSVYFEMKSVENEKLSIEMGLLDMLELRQRPTIAEIIRKMQSLPADEKKNSIGRENPDRMPWLQSPNSETKVTTDAEDGICGRFMDECRKLKNYLFSRLKSGYDISESSGGCVVRRRDSGKILDSQDTDFIKNWFMSKGRSVVFEGFPQENADLPDNDAPVPDDGGRTVNDFGVDEKPHPAVAKIIDFFQGEIVEPRKQKNNKIENGE